MQGFRLVILTYRSLAGCLHEWWRVVSVCRDLVEDGPGGSHGRLNAGEARSCSRKLGTLLFQAMCKVEENRSCTAIVSGWEDRECLLAIP